MARQWMNRLAIDWTQGIRPQDYPQIAAITKAANEYGVDVVLSPARLIGNVDQVHDDYAGLVRQCPLVRAVELDASLLAVPGYDIAVLTALHESGRRTSLEIRDGESHPELLALALSQGVPVRATARLRCDTAQPSPSCTGIPVANNPRTHDFEIGRAHV